jgi:cysteine synthase A
LLSWLVILGLVPYAWMVFRSWRALPISFDGPLETLTEVWFFVSRAGYAGVDESVSADWLAGVGTGGTVTGVGRVLREELGKAVRVIAVEPAGSAVLSGGSPGMHGIQGLGAGFVPPIVDRAVIDDVVVVSDVAAERMARRLAREEGLLVGPSSGANVHAATEVLKGGSSGPVVTILCDSGERYLF